MNVTPATAARQITVARRVNRVQANVLVYSTKSGDTSFVPTVQAPVDEHEPHCFVCKRHTDHYAEHDNLVEQGKAYYTPEGDVWPMGEGPRFWK